MELKVNELKKKVEELKIKSVEGIVKGIARKYASIYVDREDLEQALWVHVLEKFGNNWESMNLSEVAKACWNKAVDIYRYNRYRYDRKAAYVEETNSNESSDYDFNEDSESSSNEGMVFSKLERAEDICLFKEIIELFPEGSKERRYVILKLFNYGILPECYINEVDMKDAIVLVGDEAEEYLYMKALGYNGKVPGSWVGKKWKMREKIGNYISK